MRPVIGITCTYHPEEHRSSLSDAYSRSVEEAGGLPLLIPLFQEECRKELFNYLEGLILGGGGDIGSFHFNEEPHPGQGQVYPPLDRQDIFLGQKALERKLPVLGICRGLQVLNVAGDGTLYQDLPEQYPGCLQHFQKMPGKHPVHTVYLSQDSLISSITRRGLLQVNSFHHQAVKEAIPPVIPVGVSPDGIVEAIEVRGHPFALGVQWHPEVMEDNASQLLFKALIEACKERRS